MCIKCRNINENAYDSTIGMCIVAIEHCGSFAFVYTIYITGNDVAKGL